MPIEIYLGRATPCLLTARFPATAPTFHQTLPQQYHPVARAVSIDTRVTDDIRLSPRCSTQT